jgi:heat shock protein HslJ
MSPNRPAGLALATILLLAGVACTAGVDPSLDGRRFLSTGATVNGVDRPLVPGTRITLGFQAGHLSASAGCNTLGAAYSVESGRLRIGDAAQTEIGCDPDRQAQDEWLFGFLGSGVTVRLTGNDLVLEDGGTVIRLLDREIADPDLPLAGPTWTVVSIIDGDAVSSVPDGVVATLRFGADGRVAISTGCNEGGGSVTVSGATLRFVDVALTKRACQGPAGEIEQAVLAVLGGEEVAFTIEARSLELRAGPRGLHLSGA